MKKVLPLFFLLLYNISSAQYYYDAITPKSIKHNRDFKVKHVAIEEAKLDGIEGSTPVFKPYATLDFNRAGLVTTWKFNYTNALFNHQNNYKYSAVQSNRLVQVRTNETGYSDTLEWEWSTKVNNEIKIHQLTENHFYANKQAISCFSYNSNWYLLEKADCSNSNKKVLESSALKSNAQGEVVSISSSKKLLSQNGEKATKYKYEFTYNEKGQLIEEKHFRNNNTPDLFLIKKYVYNAKGLITKEQWFQPYYEDPFRIYRYTYERYWLGGKKIF